MLRLNHITFACEDPRRVAEFWAEMLAYDVGQPPHSDSWQATDPSKRGTSLFFNRLAKTRTIELPVHLDVNVPDREAEIDRLRGLGATVVNTRTNSLGDLSETWTIMRDPEGNGFCVQEVPDGDRRYVGNVTFSCAEPVPLAKFYSQALGWPEEDVSEDFLQQLRDAGLDEWEFSAFAAVREGERTRPRLLFQRREKSPTTSIPIHLDFRTDDREAEVERLAALGATVGETKSSASGHTWTLMRDPEGIPFCVE